MRLSGAIGLGHLVRIAGRGQPGTDVKELPDASLGGQVAHAAGEEGPVGACGRPDRGVGGDGFLAGDPVGLKVVLTAQPVVIDPGRVGHPGVKAVEAAGARRPGRLRRLTSGHRHPSSPSPKPLRHSRPSPKPLRHPRPITTKSCTPKEGPRVFVIIDCPAGRPGLPAIPAPCRTCYLCLPSAVKRTLRRISVAMSSCHGPQRPGSRSSKPRRPSRRPEGGLARLSRVFSSASGAETAASGFPR